MAVTSTVISIVGKFVDQVTPGIDKVSSKLGGLSSISTSLDGKLRGLSSSFGRIGTIIAGGSFLALANQALQAAEALQNASIQTGISTDALQRLEFAAGLSGTSLQQVSSAITKMQKALVTSGEGSEQAVQTLARLGIATSDLLSLAPDKQFEKIAIAMADIKDPAERATAAVALFGRSGAELLPTLTAIGEGAAKINGQFAEMGGTVSTDAIAKVDEFGDNLDILKVAIKNLSIEILALLSGPLTELSNRLTKDIGMLRALAGAGGEMQRLSAISSGLERGATASAQSAISGSLPATFLALKGLFSGAETGVAAVRRQIAGLEQDAAAAKLKAEALKEIQVEASPMEVPDFDALAEAATRASEARADAAAKAAQARADFERKVFNETATYAERALNTLAEKTDLLRQARELNVIEAKTEVARYAEIIREYNDAITQGLEEVQMKGAEKITEMSAPLNEMTAAQERAAESIQDAFVTAFSNIDQGIGGMVKGFLKAFAQILAQAAALDLANALGIGKALSGGGGGGKKSFLGDIVAGIFKGFTGRASGGLVSGAAIVGEDGPELLLSGGTSMVMNRRQLAFGGGGGAMAYSPTTNIIVQGDVNRESEGRLLAYIESTRSKDQREMMRMLERNGMRNIR